MMNLLRHIRTFTVVAFVLATLATVAFADAPEYSIGSSWDKYFGLFYKGASHGVKAEQNFEVWRDGKKIGIFTVRQLSDTVSKGIFTPDSQDEILKDGDKLRPAAASVQSPPPTAGTTKDDKAAPKQETASSSDKKAETPAQTVEQPKPAAEAKQEQKPATTATTEKNTEKVSAEKKTETQPSAAPMKKAETQPAATPAKQEKATPEPAVATKDTAPKKPEEAKKETPKEPDTVASTQAPVETKAADKPAEKPVAATMPADGGEKQETTSARRERVVALKKVEEEDKTTPAAQKKTSEPPATSGDVSKSTTEKKTEPEKTKTAVKPATDEPAAKTEQKAQEQVPQAKIEEAPAPAKEVKPAETPAATEKSTDSKPSAASTPAPQDEPKKAEKQLKDIPPKSDDAPLDGGEWTAERHVYKANSFFIDRSYHRALEHYAAALAIDPANEYARKGVVESSKKLGIVSPLAETAKPDATRQAAPKSEEEPKKQTTYFTKDDEALLDNSGTYNNFGVYLIKQNDYAQAVEWLDKAIERNANVPLYFRNRAVANYRLGNILDAVHDAKKAMDLGDERAKEMLKTLRGLIQAEQTTDN